ncbi:MAG TPA: rRNA maturation RNase YbeY [Planctomycetota bacterium]|nr:rRNA maturation RNase YbeY [Planctomycetota bacterium]HRR82407.1 rRNA maturation RNase YbeY [Planctomycetota bacterium]HRT96111.1 rRNA maturation RNase YbeY [Planctomycetota bacterium]
MTIGIVNRQRLAPLDRRALRALCRRLLIEHEVPADLSLCYVDNAEIRALNARYLGHGHVTDVLAFPLCDPSQPAAVRLLGEVIVSVEKAIAEAARRRIPVAREIALYTAHGVLHLLGYDDHDPADRRRMRRAERQALAAAGLL